MNHPHLDKTTAALEQQSQTRLRRVTTSDVKTMSQLPNAVALGRSRLAGHSHRFRGAGAAKNSEEDMDNRPSASDKKCEVMMAVDHEQNYSPTCGPVWQRSNL